MSLEISYMTLTKFLLQNSLQGIRFFEKIFLLTNTSIKVILGMFFLSFSNTKVKFAEKLGKLTQKSYIAAKVLLITSLLVQLSNKRNLLKQP